MKRADDTIMRAEILIAWILRIGVIVCGTVITLGLLSRFLGFGAPSAHPWGEVVQQLLGGGLLPAYEPVTSVATLSQGVLHWQADTVMTVGILLLIGLPILRVATTVVVFFYERDWIFVAITLLVLSVLLSGIILGKAL